MKFGDVRTIFGPSTTLEEHEAADRAVLEEQVRQARLVAARRCGAWTEIEADL